MDELSAVRRLLRTAIAERDSLVLAVERVIADPTTPPDVISALKAALPRPEAVEINPDSK